MPSAIGTGRSSARITIHAQDYEETGTCIVLRTKPLIVLVPSHVSLAIEHGLAEKLVIGSDEHVDFKLLPAPFLESEHLAIIECRGTVSEAFRPVPLPRRAKELAPGEQLECHKQVNSEERTIESGTLTQIVVKGIDTTLITDIRVRPGDSGCPLLLNKRLAGICVGMTGEGASGDAIAIPLSPIVLRELQKIVFRARRIMVASLISVLLVAVVALGVRSWTTFRIAGIDGPMNSAQSGIETPNTLIAHNAQLLTLRSTWSRTFPTSIRWWVPFASSSDEGRIDYIVVGTRAEQGIHGSLYLLDNMGRIAWSHTVPNGECVYRDEEGVFNGFNVYRAFVGDLTGDGRSEILASFVHDYWYPCQILIFNQEGEILGKFWHPGYVRTFAIGKVGNSETPMLIMTGSNNRFRALDSPWNPQGLMAFDVAELTGEAPPYTGSGEPGNMIWYYLLPDMDAEHKSYIDEIIIEDSDGDGLTEILAHTTDDRFYYLDEHGTVLRVHLGDEYLKEFGYVDAPDLQQIDLDPSLYEDWPL